MTVVASWLTCERQQRPEWQVPLCPYLPQTQRSGDSSTRPAEPTRPAPLTVQNALLLIPNYFSQRPAKLGEVPRATAKLTTRHSSREVSRAYAWWRLPILFSSKYQEHYRWFCWYLS